MNVFGIRNPNYFIIKLKSGRSGGGAKLMEKEE
jgi:hypothetical protein